jgi:hypothetical protein
VKRTAVGWLLTGRLNAVIAAQLQVSSRAPVTWPHVHARHPALQGGMRWNEVNSRCSSVLPGQAAHDEGSQCITPKV